MKTNFWYWSITIIALTFSLFSCSEDGPSREEVEEIQNVFYDYQVEDIEGLDLKTVKSTYCGDTAFFMGVKNGFMWVAMFDQQTKEQLQVWESKDPLRSLVVEPLEYGEVHELEPECFDLYSLTRTSWGFAAYVHYETLTTEENNWENDWINADVVFLHTDNGQFQRFQTNEDGISGVSREHWYNDGIVYKLKEPCVEGKYFACDPQGVHAYLETCPYDDDYPAHLETGIRFQNYSHFYVSVQNYANGNEVWRQRAPFLEDIDSDARQTWTVTEQTEISVDFQVDIVHRNGEREQITFSVGLYNDGGVYQTNRD